MHRSTIEYAQSKNIWANIFSINNLYVENSSDFYKRLVFYFLSHWYLLLPMFYVKDGEHLKRTVSEK